MNKIYFYTLFSFFVVQFCIADVNIPDSNNLRTLEDYLVYASLNNSELKSKFNQWQASLEKIPQAKSLADPQFTYGKLIRQSDMQMNQYIGIMQVFPWLGTIEARTDAASANAKAVRQQFEAERLKLNWQVKKDFYEYLYLKEAVDIAQQNLDLIKYFEQVARTKYQTAAASHPDIIRAQIELAKFDEILVSLGELKKPQIARLNALLNRPSDSMLDWPIKPAISKLAVDYSQLLNLLKQKNPEIAELQFQIESAKSEIRLAQKKFYPDIGVGVEWTGFDRSGGNSGRDAVALMFQMNIPLWRENYKAAEMEARMNERMLAYRKRNVENNLAAQAAQVLYDIEETQRKINLYNDIVPKSQQLVEASQTAYRAGTIDFLSLIDSQRMLLQYTLDYQRAVADNQQKLAEMEMLVGADLTN